ncbi:MAG: trypsin-like serine peptidase, partial [Lysobacterales bacterium]
LPPGATLYVIGADDYWQGPYTAADATGASFHAPVVPGDTAMVELRIPAGVALAPDALELTRVGAGFRDVFGRKRALDTGPGTSGACNIDVICPLGQPYPDEIRAVGQYEYEADDDHQQYLCTGTLVADVPHDKKNYFLTAAHCASTATEAASMVIYWNYQSTHCNLLTAPPGGFLNDDQHGATVRATRTDADFSLLELSHAPDTAWNLYYAGWDASGVEPQGTIGIHHPSGDVKKITAGPAPTTIDNCIADVVVTPHTHWKTGPYMQGTTEGGSSGSGLFVVSGNGGGHDRRLIGTLSGGDAACSTISPGQPNDGWDCYGKFASAWNGATAAARLRDWLDPTATGATGIAGIGQNDSAPPTTLAHSRHAIPDVLLHQPRRR